MLLTLISLIPELELPLAHETDMPHQEEKSAPSENSSALVIGGVVLLTVLLLGALIWLKERSGRAEKGDTPEAPSEEGSAPASGS